MLRSGHLRALTVWAEIRLYRFRESAFVNNDKPSPHHIAGCRIAPRFPDPISGFDIEFGITTGLLVGFATCVDGSALLLLIYRFFF
jgi:hypothetical protein